MHSLDTRNKFHESKESVLREGLASIEFVRRDDGSVDIVATQSTKKVTGQRWATETVVLKLDTEQRAAIKELLS